MDFPQQLARRLTLLLVAGLPVSLTASLRIEGADPTSSENIRFANDPSFIAGDRLTGVGRSVNYGDGTWGTLISPSVVLSAFHWHPEVGHSLTFHASNDPNGPSVTRQVIAGERIGTSDLWIGVLERSVPSEYEPYPLIDQVLANASQFEGSSLFGEVVFMLGRAVNNIGDVTNLAAGMNRMELWHDDFTDSDGTTDDALLAIEHGAPDSDFITHEAYARIYDSGTPLLMDVDGVLTLIGITWFSGYQANISPNPFFPEFRNATGFSYVGNHLPPIESVVAAYAINATPGYADWTGTAFPPEAGLALTGPALDSDLDGLLNLTEYAYNLDPLDPASRQAMVAARISDGNDRFLGLSGQLREDPGLLYFVLTGSDLSGWTRVNLTFADGSWSSSDPSRLIIDSASPLGDGLWQVALRSPNALQPGSPVFLLPGVDPLPY